MFDDTFSINVLRNCVIMFFLNVNVVNAKQKHDITAYLRAYIIVML